MCVDFIQALFEEVSLVENVALWMSDDDSRAKLEERMRFLLKFDFKNELANARKTAAMKNAQLAQAFLDKGLKFIRENKLKEALNCLDRAYFTCESHQTPEIAAKRIELSYSANKIGDWIGQIDRIVGLNAKLIQPSSSSSSSSLFESAEILSDENRGRFVVAARDIKPGEMFAVDRPKVVILTDSLRTKTHCWNCLLKLVPFRSFVPCKNCSEIVFCSESCSENAYHSFECGKIDILYKANLGTWILVPRAVLIDDDQVSGLVTHYGTTGYSTAPELMKEALICSFLAHYLRDACKFTKYHLEELALKCHKMMRIIKFNCHEVLDPEKCVIGFALNPVLAMINHSCDSNYGRVWNFGENGLSVSAFATRKISRGEEIADCYGGTFSRADYQSRREVHARYQFECVCSACANGWPTIAKIPTAGIDEKMKKKLKELNKCQDVAGQFDLVLELMEMSARKLRPPHALFVQLEEQLHNLLWAKYSTT